MGRSTHLKLEDRHFIHVSLDNGKKYPEIAAALNRHPSCISKEVKLNSDPIFKSYTYLVAHQIAQDRIKQSRQAKHKINKIPKAIIDELFDYHLGIENLGLEEVAVVLRKKYQYRLSYNSLYRYIARDKLANGTLYKSLPRKGKRYRYKDKIVSVKINGKVSIDLRPDKALLLQEAGHYEIDTIYGKDQESFLLTIVDIATLYTIIIKLNNKEAKSVETALEQLFSNGLLPLKSITSDNGTEFACHTSIKNKFAIQWYFCHPYCSWERGLNENTNGLIRRFFPKGTDFNQFDTEVFTWVQNILNNRYRKRIGYLQPKALMVSMMKSAA